jgi:hypothetical protein
MTKDTKITGVKIIIERDNSDVWEDLTPYLPDDAAEALEQMLDQMEDAMNMDIQLQVCGGLH